MSTHNLCFRAKIRKNVYPSKPQFYYIKVGCKGVFVTRTCFRDGDHIKQYIIWLFRHVVAYCCMKVVQNVHALIQQ